MDQMRTKRIDNYMNQLAEPGYFEKKVSALKGEVSRFDEEEILTTAELEHQSKHMADLSLARVKNYVSKLSDRKFASSRSKKLAREMNDI